MGHRPSVVDSRELWSFHRSRASGADRHTLVLLGASRIQLGFSPGVFQREYPRYRIIQLAIDGRQPMAALNDLAGDDSFAGTVLCDVTETSLLPAHRLDQEEYVQFHRRESSLNLRLNAFLRAHLQELTVLLRPSLGLRPIVRSLFTGDLPRPHYLTTHADRSRLADYSLSDLAAQKKFRVERVREVLSRSLPVSDEEWRRAVEEAAGCVRRIEARGGRVIFTCYVMTGESRRLMQEAFPRIPYWDVLAAKSGAATIHFEDVPALRNFECPEESHLDARDVDAYTLALTGEMERLGLIER